MGCGASSAPTAAPAAAVKSAVNPQVVAEQSGTSKPKDRSARYEVFNQGDSNLGHGATGTVVLGRRWSTLRRASFLAAPRLSSRRAAAAGADRSRTVLDRLCAVKVFDATDCENFQVEVLMLQQLCGSGYCPKLLDFTVVQHGVPQDTLQIVMERGVISLHDRVRAGMDFCSELIQDADLPECETGLPSMPFVKRWSLINIGRQPWLDGSIHLVHVRGDLLDGVPEPVPRAAQGQTVTVSVNMKAPEEVCECSGVWQLQHTSPEGAATRFGATCSVGISFCFEECECGFRGSRSDVSEHEKHCDRSTFECACGFAGCFQKVNDHEAICEQALAAAAAESEAAHTEAAQEEKRATAASESAMQQGAKMLLSQERDTFLGSEPMSSCEIRQLMARLLDALAQVHQLGYVYLDLKPENVMRFVDMRWGLIDFGSVIKFDEEVKAPFEFTTCYMPPEVALTMAAWWAEADAEKADEIGMEMTPAMDVYTLGLTFLEVASSGGPVLANALSSCNDDEEWYHWLAAPDALESVLRHRLAMLGNSVVQEFVRGMLEREPSLRPPIQECITHRWLTLI